MRRRVAVIAATLFSLILVVAPVAAATKAVTPLPDKPGFGMEPGTGTDVLLAPPATAPAGARIVLPLTITLGRGEPAWDTAHLAVAVEGPVSATHDLDLGSLAEDGLVMGQLVVDIETGTDKELSHGSVTVRLELLDGADVATVRLTRLRLMADEETTYLGFVGPTDLERLRLRALYAAGEITWAEFDEAYAETLDKVAS